MYIKYAGIILSDLLHARNIEIDAVPDRRNISIDIPSKHGEIYNGFKYGTREITLDFIIKQDNDLDYEQCVIDIANALDVNVPSRLYLEDETKYYYAVPNGKVVINAIGAGYGEGSISFICYDPMVYSDEPKVFEGTKNITATNEGTTAAYPIIRANFSKEAHFVQITNSDTGQALLIGEWPDSEKDSQSSKSAKISDNCETTTDWLPAGNVVDLDRTVEGAVTINTGGYGIIASNFGTTTDQKWHGPAVRRNLNANIQDFEIIATFEHDSKGKNASNAANTPPSTQDNNVQYQTTANLNIRSGRGTSNKVIATMPKGTKVKVTDISKGWGKVTYSSKTGYCSMQYMKLISGSSNSTHKVSTGSSNKGLILRSSRSTSGKILLSIPNGTALNVTDIKSGWGKTTYKSKTGYVSTQYLIATKSLNTDIVRQMSDTSKSTETADDKHGLIELYGFDSNGQKLFRMHLRDSQSFYEYTTPEVKIGNSTVLKDTSTVPKPKTKKVKDDKGKETIVNDLSGKFGKWNEFYGNIKIRRETVNGKNKWSCEVNKIKDGKVVETLKSTSLFSDDYPKGNLNHLVLYIGAYQDKPISSMSLTHVSVNQLNKVESTVNKKIFKNGDELEIDCSSNMVYLNSEPYMQHLDIGSEFFELSSGNTDILIHSDDNEIFSTITLTERWL